ncbi:alkaline phosphatase family protein [Dethiosulfatarculus sandiegensis]|uniref:Phosphodiesterase n=1 Tax=Dethiosulfatarculus sandiegensis TaxID=1429043 RepID=A0A0D2GME4_9BACT|nr:alkaline phosphatase family protein [Dethiosulfatarculus sandiegensis]KIX15857.1 phosphodiesterase [Dethiosulfatarculus sandiegensis]
MSPGKLMVIGLDGVGLDLARHLADKGVMPNLRGLMAQGKTFGCASPLPEVSPVCWTSMFSGTGPGVHGIFGFAEHKPGTYDLKPVDSSMVRAPRIWQDMHIRNQSSVVLNVPLTYPAEEVKGVMVSGFVTPDLRRGVRPLLLLPSLVQKDYRPEADLDMASENPVELARDLEKALSVRLAVFEEMMAREWDLFVGVVTDTDRVNHFMWPALFDQAHPLSENALGLYALVDAFLGRVWQRVRGRVESGELSLMILADHGFGPVKSEVYLNAWLREKGYLKIAGEPGNEVILPETLALALDPGRIYLHTASRFPNGKLVPGAYADSLLAEIAKGLKELCHGSFGRQEPVVEAVHWGRELFSGPYAHMGPDLAAVGARGYSLRAGLDKPEVFGLSHITGTHRPHDALALVLGRDISGRPPTEVAGLHGLMKQALGMADSGTFET